MGIDINRLGPDARRQIEQQLGRSSEPRNKYRTQPTMRGDLRFDSRKEARRYDVLLLMLKAGTIRELKLQPQFTLQEAYTTPEGVRVRAIRYQADFSYEEYCPALIAPEGGGTWLLVVEDVKSAATKTRVYAIKKKLLLERYGIEVREI